MPCKAQNAWIESASAFGSTPCGFRLYFGGRSVCAGFFPVISPRAIAVASVKLYGRRYSRVVLCVTRSGSGRYRPLTASRFFWNFWNFLETLEFLELSQVGRFNSAAATAL